MRDLIDSNLHQDKHEHGLSGFSVGGFIKFVERFRKKAESQPKTLDPQTVISPYPEPLRTFRCK